MPTTSFTAAGIDFATVAPKVHLSRTDDDTWIATITTYAWAGGPSYGTVLNWSVRI